MFESFKLTSDGTEESFSFTEELYAQCALVVEKCPRHVLLELKRFSLGSEDVDVHKLESVLPKLVVKDGENVLKATTTQLLFLFFNHLWVCPNRYFPDPDTAPFCVTYDSIPTAKLRGFEEYVPDAEALNEFDFEHWRKTKGKDPTIVDGFLRSAAGVFAAVYVCGMIDFNSSALAVKDGESLFLREYETIVQPGQCRYASRVLIPKQMKACLKALKVWDTFIHNTERAFSVLQTSCDSLLHVMGSLCEKSDVSDGQANQYLGSIIARKRGQKNEKKTIELFRKWLI